MADAVCEDLVLSDVHVDRPSYANTDGTLVTVFEFRRVVDCLGEIPTIAAECADDGVDYDDARGHQDTLSSLASWFDAIPIVHKGSTSLADVGAQVWRGSLFLADYILSNQELFSGKSCLELGAGTGLCSIIAARFASNVYCTDTGREVLELCLRNVQNNACLLPKDASLVVKELDWCRPRFEAANTLPVTSGHHIAVVYEEDLTDAFFRLLCRLLEAIKQHRSSPKTVTVIISLEKRLNFTLEDLDIAAPAYTHFRVWLDRLRSTDQSASHHRSPLKDDARARDDEMLSSMKFAVARVHGDFPQWVDYKRVKELELWEITATTC